MSSEPRFDLIETMRHDPRDGVIGLDRHLARLKASAAELGFAFNRHDARNELQAASFGAGEAEVRLLLARGGAMAVEVRPLAGVPAQPVMARLTLLPVEPDDRRLRHSTSDRRVSLPPAEGVFETIYVKADGRLWGARTRALIIERGGMLLTPRGRASGIGDELPEGVETLEAELGPDDLLAGFLLADPLHGLLRGALVSR